MAPSTGTDQTHANRKASRFDVSTEWTSLTGHRLIWCQVAALMRKNIAVRRRAWKTNLLLIAQAAVFMALTWMVDNAVKASNQRRPAFSSEPIAVPKSIGPIPDCAENIYLRRDEYCLTLLYAPKGEPAVEAIISAVARNNDPPIPEDRVRGFSSGSAIDEYLLQHWNSAIAAVEFVVHSHENIGFSVQTNSSVQWFKGQFQDPNLYAQLPVQVAVEREIVRYVKGTDTLTWKVDVAEFPHPSSKSPSAIGTLLPTFLFASIMFGFVLQLYDLLVEKERGVRQFMMALGLQNSSHWISWIQWQFFLAFIQTILLVGFGYAFNFPTFTKNSFGLSFSLLLGANLSMTCLGFLIGVFPKQSSAAVPLGFFFFILGWMFIVIVGSGFPYSRRYSDSIRFFFNCMPWTLLAKGIQDLTIGSNGNSEAIPWSLRSSYCYSEFNQNEQFGWWQAPCILSVGKILTLFLIQSIIYLALAIYFDAKIFGDGKASWFLAHHFFANKKKESVERARDAVRNMVDEDSYCDDDVLSERNLLKILCQRYLVDDLEDDDDNESNMVVNMWGVSKQFQQGIPFARKAFTALDNLWLGIKQGECFCLLGPNGAGKTTLIECLTGLTSTTRGEIVVNSLSVVSDLKLLRQFIGVCPQFDTALWLHLNAREHIDLFASIKGIPKDARNIECEMLLDKVNLSDVATIPVAAFSGGMKRRLSVAISLIGDPKLVLLDEPTTGLDPISRRLIWDVIDKMKKTRAIIFTTHSMEEADILSDRIGIMVRGRLRCLGTNVRLKSRFGSGYRLSLRIRRSLITDKNTENGHSQRIKCILEENFGIKSFDESHDYLHFVVDHENEDKLPYVLSHLKANLSQYAITDIQVRLSPLEEVFLNVTRKAELEYAQKQGKYEFLSLEEENIVVKVPVGAEFIKSPSGNFYYVLWVQNECGNLKLQDYWKDPINDQLDALRLDGSS